MGRPRTTSGGGVLIADRFKVREAIRHSNKGGVYRALDTRTGDMLIIKEARPHVAADESGKDTRDRLRAEYRALERLQHLGVAPKPVALFTEGGHLFLAQEMIPGTSLHQWVAELIADAGWRKHLPQAFEMAGRLADLMITAHDAGLVLRDFNPNNTMVRPDSRPMLIDLELAAFVDDDREGPIKAGTPGYAAPEQLDGSEPAPSADYYGLGATLCYLFTGSPPYFLKERPKARPLAERQAEWLEARTYGLDVPSDVRRAILGLIAEEPTERWKPSRVRDIMRTRASARTPAHRDDEDRAPAERPVEECRQAIEGIVDYLIASMTPVSGQTLWPASCAHGAPDPCSLQHGAAGPLGVLVRCFELTADPRLPDAIATASRWIDRRLTDDITRPPGLYFGTAGTAWSLLEAGRALGDDRLAEKAVALARALPVSTPNPDMTHGTAGIGLTALHVLARTGDTAFAERASASADILLATVDEESDVLGWATPAESESKLAGRRYYGFAHGIAGVG
jgi:serine/threonine protein kinase